MLGRPTDWVVVVVPEPEEPCEPAPINGFIGGAGGGCGGRQPVV